MIKMKKLLLVLAVGAFVACNNSGSTDATADTAAKSTTDTTVVTPDSTVIKIDTTATPDTTKK
jgi:FAD/FMN-containing dehydrogenase